MSPNDTGSFYDLIIVGAGAAGWSAGIFAARRGHTPHVLSTDCGGQTATTAEIENYPGVGSIEGPDLVARFMHEAGSFGCTFASDTVQKLICGTDIILKGVKAQYRCRALIIAAGKSPRMLGIPGEGIFFGKGVLFAGAFSPDEFRGMRVAVAGGGNSALDSATRLAPFAKTVALIHRRDRFTAEAVLEKRLKDARNISPILNTSIIEIRGVNHIESLLLSDSARRETALPIDALIVAIGYEVRASWYADVLDCTEEGKIRIDAACRTNRKGIFSAGDCTTIPFQQIVVSAGEGAKAGLSASRYLNELDGKRNIRVDWGYI